MGICAFATDIPRIDISSITAPSLLPVPKSLIFSLGNHLKLKDYASSLYASIPCFGVLGADEYHFSSTVGLETAFAPPSEQLNKHLWKQFDAINRLGFHLPATYYALYSDTLQVVFLMLDSTTFQYDLGQQDWVREVCHQFRYILGKTELNFIVVMHHNLAIPSVANSATALTLDWQDSRPPYAPKSFFSVPTITAKYDNETPMYHWKNKLNRPFGGGDLGEGILNFFMANNLPLAAIITQKYRDPKLPTAPSCQDNSRYTYPLVTNINSHYYHQHHIAVDKQTFFTLNSKALTFGTQSNSLPFPLTTESEAFYAPVQSQEDEKLKGKMQKLLAWITYHANKNLKTDFFFKRPPLDFSLLGLREHVVILPKNLNSPSINHENWCPSPIDQELFRKWWEENSKGALADKQFAVICMLLDMRYNPALLFFGLLKHELCKQQIHMLVNPKLVIGEIDLNWQAEENKLHPYLRSSSAQGWSLTKLKQPLSYYSLLITGTHEEMGQLHFSIEVERLYLENFGIVEPQYEQRKNSYQLPIKIELSFDIIWATRTITPRRIEIVYNTLVSQCPPALTLALSDDEQREQLERYQKEQSVRQTVVNLFDTLSKLAPTAQQQVLSDLVTDLTTKRWPYPAQSLLNFRRISLKHAIEKFPHFHPNYMHDMRKLYQSDYLFKESIRKQITVDIKRGRRFEDYEQTMFTSFESLKQVKWLDKKLFEDSNENIFFQFMLTQKVEISVIDTFLGILRLKCEELGLMLTKPVTLLGGTNLFIRRAPHKVSMVFRYLYNFVRIKPQITEYEWEPVASQAPLFEIYIILNISAEGCSLQNAYITITPEGDAVLQSYGNVHLLQNVVNNMVQSSEPVINQINVEKINEHFAPCYPKDDNGDQLLWRSAIKVLGHEHILANLLIDASSNYVTQTLQAVTLGFQKSEKITALLPKYADAEMMYELVNLGMSEENLNALFLTTFTTQLMADKDKVSIFKIVLIYYLVSRTPLVKINEYLFNDLYLVLSKSLTIDNYASFAKLTIHYVFFILLKEEQNKFLPLFLRLFEDIINFIFRENECQTIMQFLASLNHVIPEFVGKSFPEILALLCQNTYKPSKPRRGRKQCPD